MRQPTVQPQQVRSVEPMRPRAREEKVRGGERPSQRRLVIASLLLCPDARDRSGNSRAF
jgi:hypothetical protein